MNINKALQRGFTLVELLIVTIILAILAAIVIPQFAATTDDAKLAALDSNLSSIRAAVDLYYQQHGSYPSANLSSGASCPASGTAGTGAINTNTAFIDQLSRYSNAAGQTCTTTDTTFTYGPYIKKDTLPKNPITDNAALVVITTGALGMTGNATPAGWKFDNKTGQFIADDAANDDR